MLAYGDSLTRLCLMYLRDVHLAEDAVQDTFLKAARNMKRFRGDASPLTWLSRIAINTCKDRLRSPWRRVVMDEKLLLNLPAQEGGLPGDDAVIQAVYSLPPIYKDVILLQYYQGLSLKQMSKALGVPVFTLSSRLRRARELLKTKLKGWYFDED